MNSDQFKPLFGIGQMEEKYTQDKMIYPIGQLGDARRIYDWANTKNGVTMMSAILGNSAQIYAAMLEAPKRTNSVMAAFGNISELTASVMAQPKATNDMMAAFSSASALKASVITESTTYNHMMAAFGSVKDIINSMPVRSTALDNAILAIGGQPRWNTYINAVTTSHYNSIDVLKNSAFLKAAEIAGFGQLPKSKSEEKKGRVEVDLRQDEINDAVTQSIDQYVESIGNVISQVSEIEETELNEIKFNFSSAIKQDVKVGTAVPLTLYVLEYIFKHYNEVLETLSASGLNHENLRHFLQTANADNDNFFFPSFLIVAFFSGWIGNLAGGIGKESKTKKALGSSSMNAVTTVPKKVLEKAHGNSKVICEIPQFTNLQLFHVKKEYVFVQFIHENSLKSGWTKNEGITDQREEPDNN